MSWFKSYFCFLVLRPWRELRRGKWGTILFALPFLSTVLTFVGVFINIRIPLPNWSTKTWLIMFLMSVISTLLLLIEGLRSYDIRTSKELREEWAAQNNAVKILSESIARGKPLYERCRSHNSESDDRLIDDITQWHRGVASDLVFEAHLDEGYKDRFYKHSNSGERTPPLNECLLWMNTRLVILKEFRQEFSQPPSQLVSPIATNELEFGSNLDGHEF